MEERIFYGSKKDMSWNDQKYFREGLKYESLADRSHATYLTSRLFLSALRFRLREALLQLMHHTIICIFLVNL